MTTDFRLADLGDALLAATTADLRRSQTDRKRATSRRRRRTLAFAAVALVAVPGGAVAAVNLFSAEEAARSIPSGTLSLLNTDPTCTTVRAGVEFDCTLAVAPTGELGAGNWLRTVEPTVDDSKHVNGGCRSLNAAGTHWRCYVGEEAIKQQIIGPALLGAPSVGPSVG